MALKTYRQLCSIKIPSCPICKKRLDRSWKEVDCVVGEDGSVKWGKVKVCTGHTIIFDIQAGKRVVMIPQKENV